MNAVNLLQEISVAELWPVAKLAVASGNQVWFVQHGAIAREYQIDLWNELGIF